MLSKCGLAGWMSNWITLNLSQMTSWWKLIIFLLRAFCFFLKKRGWGQCGWDCGQKSPLPFCYGRRASWSFVSAIGHPRWLCLQWNVSGSDEALRQQMCFSSCLSFKLPSNWKPSVTSTQSLTGRQWHAQVDARAVQLIWTESTDLPHRKMNPCIWGIFVTAA